jgi:hypothetical protein
VLDLMEADARNARCINAFLNYHMRSICRLLLAAINHPTIRRDRPGPTARRDASAHRLEAAESHPAQVAHMRREADYSDQVTPCLPPPQGDLPLTYPRGLG